MWDYSSELICMQDRFDMSITKDIKFPWLAYYTTRRQLFFFMGTRRQLYKDY